ncbi:MAG: HAD family hydrolase [Lentisphaerae bacterium]|jgi:FMN hydrolase / 5-amino-6-(5-phospho-D-ribitylamino)uracil phosphatase|nr:HAD family hydrolase [Lentisphaerota bacterium]MBT4815101.1 HAD family hydrolase [Lentisphaerota bacterium]MBT5611556.1 HAD family hydrolase [Lentisphaerota bacterium]MBT7059583.1 HAD family hydrolase [Lentisphaerota bacterium]MBT7844983.1 HAD family hydrolase [Lentisphaerota bacterium]
MDNEWMCRIRVISFDGDDTLWDFGRVMRHSLKHALEELRVHVPGARSADLTIDEMIAIRDRLAGAERCAGVRLEEVRRLAFEETLVSIGVRDPALAGHLNAVYLKHRFGDIELYDDVLPAFDALAKRFQLGLLTNGNTYPKCCGLEAFFQFAVFAQDHGFEKPDPRLFHVALQEANCLGGDMLHVGDSLRADVAGAQNAGVKSVWLNRDRARMTGACRPDLEIARLTELIALLPDAEKDRE